MLADGAVHAVYRKVYLPNYGVFDEQRYFQAGPAGAVIDVGRERLGLTVCEDIWEPGPPASDEALAGATLILNISASPYHAGKGAERERMFAQRARENLACVAFCALVGGQDELVFDGHSFVIDHTGQTIARAAQFREELLICDVDLEAAAAARLRESGHRASTRSPIGKAGGPTGVAVLPGLPATAEAGTDGGPAGGPLAQLLEPVEAEIYAALTLGLRDYVQKNGFGHVVLGLSGGIDSALVACLAVDALGAERVSVAIMPSPFSSSATQDDARALAAALGVQVHELAIEPVDDTYAETLGGAFEGREHDLTEENLQARIRGNLLMALSNKFGWLVLTTGNKSEMSVGYTTLYGDLAGGFAVIKDVPKTLVYGLCAWRNSPQGRSRRDAWPSPIPQSIIERAPSAELRPDQRDEDSLPPYERARPDPARLRRAPPSREQLSPRGCRRSDVERAIAARRPRRVQAPPGTARDQDHAARLRPRPAHADHQPLPRLSRQMSAWRNTRMRPPARIPNAAPDARAAGAARGASSGRASSAMGALAALLAGCALALGACGDTLQDHPIPHNTLESLIVAPYPVYWLGGSFQGLQITEASHDPSGAFTVQYGDCVVGGQSTCVTPVTVITSPDNSFVAGRLDAAAHGRAARRAGRARTAWAHDRDPHGRRRRQRLCRQRAPGCGGGAHDRADQRGRRTGRIAARAPAEHGLRLDAAALAGALAAARAALTRSAHGSGHALRQRPHGDRHARERARAPGVVGEAHVPHPCRAPAVQARGLRVHDALGDRAQEARVVGQTHRDVAFPYHRERRGHRGHRLGDRRIHATVHEPRRLLELVAHGHLRASPPGRRRSSISRP